MAQGINTTLYIQYSQAINWDYSTGRVPSGKEEGWLWEEKFIPVAHMVGTTLSGAHRYRRERVGITSEWSYPQPIVGISVEKTDMVYDYEDDTYQYFKLQTTLDDGTVYDSDTLIPLKKGVNGKDADGVDNVPPDTWFNTQTELKAYTGYVNGVRYGIFADEAVYIYDASATSGIKPNNVSGVGRYVLDYSFSGQFATTNDMEQSPLVEAAKSVTPYLLQHWWNIAGATKANLVHTHVVSDIADFPSIPTDLGDLSGNLDDIADGTTYVKLSNADAIRLANTSGTNTGDQDLSSYQLNTLTQGKIWKGNSSNIAEEVDLPDSGWSTVGTGGTYATLQDAFDAGKTHIYLVSNITLTSNLTVRAAMLGEWCIIKSNMKTLNLGNYIISRPVDSPSYFVFDSVNLFSSYSGRVSSNCYFGFQNSKVTFSGEWVPIANFIKGYTDFNNDFVINSSGRILGSTNYNVFGGRITFNNPTPRFRFLSIDNVELCGSLTEQGGAYSAIQGAIGSTIFNVSGTYSGDINLNEGSVISGFNLPSATVRVRDAGNGKPAKISNGNAQTFTQSALALKATLSNVSFTNDITIHGNISAVNMDGGTLDVSGEYNEISGGTYTTIVVNGNNNIVQNIKQSASITVNPSATGNRIINNNCDTISTLVSGNVFQNNNEY